MEIRNSPVEGFGVFATDFIPKDTILEEVPFVLFPRHISLGKNVADLLQKERWISDRERYIENLRQNLSFKDPEKYYFKWHPPHQFDDDCMFTVLPLGFGPIYNSSNTSSNADWKMSDKTFVFSSVKDIQKDEEIRTFYGYLLGEDGTIFVPENVFNLAIDKNDNKLEIRSLKFGTMNSYEMCKNSSACLQVLKYIENSSSGGIVIKCLVSISVDGQESKRYVIPENISLTDLYKKIFEFKSGISPLVVFFFEYTNKEGKVVTEKLPWKK